MFGGIAVAGNLLCIAYTAARGHLFLVDLEDMRVASHWDWRGRADFGDAGGVAMDRDYNIWVADTRNDVVRRFSPFGRDVGRLGAPHERAPGSVRRDRRGVLDRPRAVAVFGEVVWVACGERWLRRGVQRFRRDGTVFAPLRSFGDIEGRFGAPRGIAAGRDGVFVADTLHGVVQRFRLGGAYVGRVSTAHDPEAVSRPVAVLPRPGGELLIADEGDAPGLRRIPLDAAPQELPLPAIEDPLDLTADAQGRVYVLDQGGDRVHRLTAELEYERVIVDLAEIGFGVD